MSDYHKILGVPKNASPIEIKKAYRKKAFELHPDKNKAADAQEKFVELTIAYDVLINGKILKQKPTYKKSPHEKYKNVHTAPTDPEEFKEWFEVARERAKEQARMEFEAFKKNNEAFRRSQLFLPAKIFSIFLMVLGFGISSYIFLAPFLFAREYGTGVMIFMALFLCPVGIWIFSYIWEFKKEFDRYFVD